MAATSNPPSGEDVAADSLEFFEHPNYTQVPNHFIDEIVPEMTSMSEIKVTILVLRATFGFGEAERLLPVTEIMRRTGLSKPSVVDGLQRAIVRGYVGRRRSKDGFVYGTRVRSKVKKLDPAESSDVEPEEVKDLDPALVRGKKQGKKNNDSAKQTTQAIFEFWVSLDPGKELARYTLTDKRRKAIEKRLDDSTKEEIAEALRGQWHDPWCQDKGKLDLEYSLRSRDQLEDFRDRRRRQVAKGNGASSNGNGQPPSAHPEYDTTQRNPIVEAIKLIDANGPRTANEVAQTLGLELEPAREMLMQMVEDGDCVYEGGRATSGEGTYARPGESM